MIGLSIITIILILLFWFVSLLRKRCPDCRQRMSLFDARNEFEIWHCYNCDKGFVWDDYNNYFVIKIDPDELTNNKEL